MSIREPKCDCKNQIADNRQQIKRGIRIAEKTRIGSDKEQSDEYQANQDSEDIQGPEYSPAKIRFVGGLLHQRIPTAAEGSFQERLSLGLIHLRIVD